MKRPYKGNRRLRIYRRGDLRIARRPGIIQRPRPAERHSASATPVGRDYPKGTGSTYRSFFAVCRWRYVSRQYGSALLPRR